MTNNDILTEWKSALTMFGFQDDSHQTNSKVYSCRMYETVNNQSICIVAKLLMTPITSGNSVYNISSYVDGVRKQYKQSNSLSTIIKSADRMLSEFGISMITSSMISPTDCRDAVITAAINTRDITKNLVRVKSSNVWSYGINIRNAKDKVGDVLTQFKGPNGGPGDIYIYYDVPIRVYRRWQSAPSKGHYFWQYIRNFYKYSKLTGDKRGKLANAIN